MKEYIMNIINLISLYTKRAIINTYISILDCVVFMLAKLWKFLGRFES